MNLPKYVIGIDPGASGGIAIATTEDDTTRWIVYKMPATERDVLGILSVALNDNPYTYRSFAMIERAQAFPIFGDKCKVCKRRPSQGIASTGKFMQNYGLLRGLLHGLNIPFDEVRPAVWQRALNCLSGGDKNVTKTKAQQLFPGMHVIHATADALLIAEYARLWIQRNPTR